MMLEKRHMGDVQLGSLKAKVPFEDSSGEGEESKGEGRSGGCQGLGTPRRQASELLL